uniref:Uncharacterized protein n=1 Tax=Arundo donax TaxID=35708 RepID=A0A0A9G4R2_ARUDO
MLFSLYFQPSHKLSY